MSTAPGARQHRVAVSQLAGFGDRPTLANGKLNRRARIRRQPFGDGDAHAATAEEVGYSKDFFSRHVGGTIDRTVDQRVITPVDHAAASVFARLRNETNELSPADRAALEAYAGILTLRNQETRRQFDLAASRRGHRLTDDEKVELIGKIASAFATTLRIQILSIVRFPDDLLVLGDTSYGMTRTDLSAISEDATRREGRPVIATASLGDQFVGSTRFVLPLTPRLAAVWQPLYLGALPAVGTPDLAGAFNEASIADSEREFYSALAHPIDRYPGLRGMPNAARFPRYRRRS